ncbi:MAG: EamA family transporter [Lachnospiraceae bacterium]|nr:EamA family transporter [Lachnospiraceae bacterium]
MKNTKGLLMVVLAGICWGVISLMIKPLNEQGLGSLEISALRTIFAAIMLFVFLLIKDRNALKIDIKDIWMFVGTGILSLTFFSVCYFYTIVNSGAAIAVVLLYTSPVFVMLMSAVIFKEKLTPKKVLCLILTLAGCTLVAGLIGNTTALGLKAIIVGLGAGFGYALYSIFGTFATKKYKSLTITFYTLLLAGVALAVFAGPAKLIKQINLDTIPYLLSIALICTVIPYIAYTYGLAGMEAGMAAVLVTIEPLVGSLIGIFIWKEEATAYKIIGILMIFAAIVVLGLSATETGSTKKENRCASGPKNSKTTE